MTADTDTKVTRRDLVERLAYERAQYELLHAGRPDAWQPLVPFVHDMALHIARLHDVDRIKRVGGVYGPTFYPRIDWKRLARDVEPAVRRFKRDIIEFDAIGHPDGP